MERRQPPHQALETDEVAAQALKVFGTPSKDVLAHFVTFFKFWGRRTSPMRFSREQVRVLCELYQANDYPSDRLTRDRRALAAFARELGNRLRLRLSPEEVAEELLRVRKDKRGTGGLPPLGRNPSGPTLS